MALRDDQRLTRSPDVLSRVLDGEAVLLDLGSGTYFGLNEVGTRTWELIGEGRTRGELRDALLDEFDIGRDILERDLDELVDALQKRSLVRVDGT